jgi:hypothetical protein
VIVSSNPITTSESREPFFVQLGEFVEGIQGILLMSKGLKFLVSIENPWLDLSSVVSPNNPSRDHQREKRESPSVGVAR